MTPQLVVLAGPNGAGKSTFDDAFLADSPLPFLNADLFAAETGVDSFEAARVLDARTGDRRQARLHHRDRIFGSSRRQARDASPAA